MTAHDTRKSVQALLGVTPDGIFGRITEGAYERLKAAPAASEWPVAVVPPAPSPGERVDDRSERAIATLHPRVQPYARSLVQRAAGLGIKIIITSGTRTYAEQDALYAQGRTKPGQIVTNARAGYSSHNFQTAFDVTIFNGVTPVWESPQYQTIGTLGKSLGLSWGGDWTSADEPHLYLKPSWSAGMSESEMMAVLRARHDSGTDVFA